MVRIVAHDLHPKIPSMIGHWAELYTATARACSVSQHVIYAQRFVPCVTGATRTRTRSRTRNSTHTRTRTRTRNVHEKLGLGRRCPGIREALGIGGTGRKAFTIRRAVPMHSYAGVSGARV